MSPSTSSVHASRSDGSTRAPFRGATSPHQPGIGWQQVGAAAPAPATARRLPSTVPHGLCRAVPCRASRVQARPRTGIHRAGRNCRRHVDKDRCTCIRAGPKHCCNVAGLPSMGSRGFAEEKIYYLPSNNSCFYNLSSRDRITNLERFMYISLYISS